MKKLTVIILGLLTLVKLATAQDGPGIKQLADRYYDRYEYYKSINLYLQLADKNKPALQVIERLADCYRNINDYANAEQWYEKAVTYPKANKTDHFYYAEILLRDEKFEEAKQQYKLYFNNGDAGLVLKLADCDSAAQWMKEKPKYLIENAKAFNTIYSDWGLTYNDKVGFIFTSDRIVDDGTDNRTGNNWFKLYQADAKKYDIKPFTVSYGLNNDYTGNYHMGPITFNKTADTAYITLSTEVAKRKLTVEAKNWQTNQKLASRRLQLVMAVKRKDEWVVISDFPYNNIQQYSVSSAALSNNGRIIYFASDMPGGEGKTDIWYCEKQAGGSWGKPINCGKNINTAQEDDFPFISPDGSLYYASKGLPGMGGYDIYAAKGEKNNWSTPQNLKYPINTTSDDFYLFTVDGTSGRLSSNRNGGAGGDDIYTWSPMLADKPGVPVASASPPTTKTGGGFVFDPIYYDLDKSNIRPDAAIELDKLVEFLKQYPTLRMEISSYTDSRAAGDYNVALSRRRAQAVVDYLTAKGIAANRLVAKWYGKTNLVNNCPDGVPCTEAQHQLNRRSEFKVIGEGK